MFTIMFKSFIEENTNPIKLYFVELFCLLYGPIVFKKKSYYDVCSHSYCSNTLFVKIYHLINVYCFHYSILDKHAVLVNCDDKVTMEPQKGARILVNGVPLLTRSQLKHLVSVPNIFPSGWY